LFLRFEYFTDRLSGQLGLLVERAAALDRIARRMEQLEIAWRVEVLSGGIDVVEFILFRWDIQVIPTELAYTLLQIEQALVHLRWKLLPGLALVVLQALTLEGTESMIEIAGPVLCPERPEILETVRSRVHLHFAHPDLPAVTFFLLQ
jgi:hypothetical protein